MIKISKIDNQNIRKVILEFPRQFRVGIEAAKKIKKIKNKFRYVFILGMGGSALPGEILKIYFEKNKIEKPFFLIQDYQSGILMKKNDLAFAISYSGNTEETISAFWKAKKIGCNLISITSGGKLAEISKRGKIETIIVPSGIPPRFALGYMFSALYYVLEKREIVAKKSKEILNLEQSLSAEKLEKIGKALAKKIENKIPIIYASKSNFPLAKIWKIKFNENSKIPAFCNFFPELNHNEMVGFTKIPNYKLKIEDFAILNLRDFEDHKRNQKRMMLTEKILIKKGLSVYNIFLGGKNVSEKIFSNVLLADWTSYYLALNYKVDPAPVKIVEEFKNLMKK